MEMKEIVCGSQKGYLLSRKDMVEGVVKICGFLKDKIVTRIHVSPVHVEVYYLDKVDQTEKDYLVINKDSFRHTVMVDVEAFKKVFGMKEEIAYSELKFKTSKGEYADIYHSYYPVVRDENLYYFVSIGHRFPEYVGVV